MDKLSFMRLWDLYGALLTPTQQDITDMYFNLDLTVSEIAEQKGVSRQSVSDCLAVCRRELGSFEERLGHEKMLTEADLNNSFLLTDVGRWAEEFKALHPEYAADIDKLNEILNKDYSQEIAAAMVKKM